MWPSPLRERLIPPPQPGQLTTLVALPLHRLRLMQPIAVRSSHCEIILITQL